MYITAEALERAGATEEQAYRIMDHINMYGASLHDPARVWQSISELSLTPEIPFEAHQLVRDAVFGKWGVHACGPPPLWYPSEQTARNTNLARFMRSHQNLLHLAAPDPLWDGRCTMLRGMPHLLVLMRDVERLQAVSVHHPEPFWKAMLQELHIRFDSPPSRMLDHGNGANPDTCCWFPGAKMNIAVAALEGPRQDPDAPAIMFASEDEPYRALQALGMGPASRVAIIMPMTPQAVAAYLAVVILGGAVVSVADSFSTEEMDARMRIANTTAAITQDVLVRGGKLLPLYTRVAAVAGKPKIVVIPADPAAGLAVRLEPGDLTWEQFMQLADLKKAFSPYSASPDEVTNVLFSSGTTGEPKAIPWTHVTPLRPAVDAWACQDVKPRDVVVWPTSLGWMMGPWLIYASLLNGAAMGLFLGAPTGRAFGEFVASARVTMLGLVPSIVKAWRTADCMQGLDWSSIRCFSSSGEASAPEDAHWLMARAGYKPILEYCGGTEIGGAFCSGTLLHPSVPSTFPMLTLGMELFILPSEPNDGQSMPKSMSKRVPGRGEVAVRAPALGTSQQLLNRDHFSVYFEAMPCVTAAGTAGRRTPLRRHGDEFEVLPGLGYFRAHGRCDDTMNLGGIKVGSVELERVCIQHVQAVVNAAAVAVPAAGGGPDLLYVFVIVASGSEPGSQGEREATGARLKAACQQAIRTHLNPLFKVHEVIVCKALPTNASNKVMRRVLRAQLMQQLSQTAKL